MGTTAAVIRQVLEEQHSLKLPDDFVERGIFPRIQSYRDNNEIVVISGLRRVGKSTLLQQVRQNSKESDYFVNFDDDRFVQFELADFQTLFEVFIELYGVQKTFYFDEIQNISGWERFVRRLHDQGNKVYVTGSNASMFSRELGTRLTGRYLQVEVYPFSFAEILRKRLGEPEIPEIITTEQRGLASRYFSEYRRMGGIPLYIRLEDTDILHNLYESVLYRDIIARYRLPSDRAIKQLVYYFASQVGKEFSYSALAKQIGVGSPTTVSDYCSYLEGSYLCYTLPRFSHSLSKQQRSNKKCYFTDHAMARVLGFRSSEDKGRLLENLIYVELRRRGEEVFFHKEERECDFVVRRMGRVHAVYQVCLDLQDPKTREREFMGLLEAMKAHGLNRGLIITESQEGFEVIKDENVTYSIETIPAWKWLLSEASAI